MVPDHGLTTEAGPTGILRMPVSDARNMRSHRSGRKGSQVLAVPAGHRTGRFRKGREAALKFLDGAPGQPAWDWEAYKRTYRSGQAAA